MTRLAAEERIASFPRGHDDAAATVPHLIETAVILADLSEPSLGAEWLESAEISSGNCTV